MLSELNIFDFMLLNKINTMFWASDLGWTWSDVMSWRDVMSWTVGKSDTIIILLMLCVIYCLMMMYVILEKGNSKMDRLMEKNAELEEDVFELISENTKLKNILITKHI
jgi:hypothetical protein